MSCDEQIYLESGSDPLWICKQKITWTIGAARSPDSSVDCIYRGDWWVDGPSSWKHSPFNPCAACDMESMVGLDGDDRGGRWKGQPGKSSADVSSGNKLVNFEATNIEYLCPSERSKSLFSRFSRSMLYRPETQHVINNTNYIKSK